MRDDYNINATEGLRMIHDLKRMSHSQTYPGTAAERVGRTVTPTWWNFDGLILQAIHQGTSIDWESLGVPPDSDEFHEALGRLHGAGLITSPGIANGMGHYLAWGAQARITGRGMQMLRAWPAEGFGPGELASAVAAAIAELDHGPRGEAISILDGIDDVANISTILTSLAQLLGHNT